MIASCRTVSIKPGVLVKDFNVYFLFPNTQNISLPEPKITETKKPRISVTRVCIPNSINIGCSYLKAIKYSIQPNKINVQHRKCCRGLHRMIYHAARDLRGFSFVSEKGAH